MCCAAVYGKLKIKEVNAVRFMMIDEICGDKEHKASLKNLDMASLPPCKRTLEQHIIRVNYQVAMWKRSHIPHPKIPDPINHGWKVLDELLQPY